MLDKTDLMTDILIATTAEAMLTSLLKCEDCPFNKTCYAKMLNESKTPASCIAYFEVVASKISVAEAVATAKDKDEVKKIIENWVAGKLKYDAEKERGNNEKAKN